MIVYRIDVEDVHAHHYRVTMTLPRPSAEQRLSLPVWIPGSYMVREFARHVSDLQARQGRRSVALEQLDKTTWLARCQTGTALQLSWRVYAFDTSVRTAFLNAQRGFFNGTSVFLRAQGREHEPHAMRIGRLPAGWSVATAMSPQAVDARGRGVYVAPDYDELVDHPVELGRFWRGRIEVRGVPHEFVVAGAWPGFDGDRLLADTRRICEATMALWHGPSAGRVGRPPFHRYVFMLHAVDDGYGGLEHRASTALIAARRDLPRQGVQDMPDGYVTLLGLISHEYFHTWNVKRLKPRELARLDYGQENYTSLLWFFEGFTSYYDDLLLLRAGLIDAPRYLKLVSKTLHGVLSTPGRRVQSVAQASFDAWVKYYRPDENTANATVSYYTKGSLVALALDLTLRSTRRPGATLDAVMRLLWQRSAGGAITQSDIAQALAQVGGRAFNDELARWVHGTGDLPLDKLLPAAGLQITHERAGLAQRLGLRLSEGPVSGVQVKTVLRGSAAERAGVSAGDELLAAQGWRLRRLDDAQAWLAPRQAFELLLSRDGRVFTVKVDPEAGDSPAAPIQLTLAPKPDRTTAARRRAWLGA